MANVIHSGLDSSELIIFITELLSVHLLICLFWNVYGILPEFPDQSGVSLSTYKVVWRKDG